MNDIFNTIAAATKPENVKTPTNKEIYLKFKKIDSDLKNKYKKVDKIIKDHVLWVDKNFYSVYDSLSNEKKESVRKYIDSLKLNDLHDTQNNLENLISDNYKNFVNWSCFLEPRKSSKVWIDKNDLECFEMNF